MACQSPVLGKGVQPAAAAAQFPAFCRAANNVAPPRRSKKSGRIMSCDAEWYNRTAALEGKVSCEFPDVLTLALLLKTIPRSHATSERFIRQLRDLEGVGRARLVAIRRARAVLIRECGPPQAKAKPFINSAVRWWATARVRRPYTTVTSAKRHQF